MSLSSQGGGSGHGPEVDFSKGKTISINYTNARPSMTAPANGVVYVSTSSTYTRGGGDDNYAYYGYSYCNISGYGIIGSDQNCMVIVKKGAIISLSCSGTGYYNTPSASATFYPFK